ncbi:MAG TPA: gephyrin-like molybdotransferase Glp [Aestuariivirgaceae bacterium]|nr:gephyrin-like molybdotransferase Glp [Aestuariivirgaceae bacterium]
MSQRRRLLDDCFLHDRDRLRHAEALQLMDERLKTVAGIEEVALTAGLGRVLAEDIVAPRPIPAFTNSAVDGYALAQATLGPEPTRLKLAGRAVAGHAPAIPLRPGEAARIFTGAVMPENADSCIMQEDVTVEGEFVIVPPGLKPGANTRKAGEDLQAGEFAARSGTRLRPQELAAIASTGRDRIGCYRPLKVALVSTGDEIVRPGAPLGHGQVYDSNHMLLLGLLQTVAAETVDYGILPDDAAAVRDAVGRAAVECDVILSTGGASRGEADYIVSTIQEMGTLHAWQIAVKPGRPLAMGQVGDCIFFGLPGNPVAVFVTFLLYARPMLARLQGAEWPEPRRFPLPAGFAMANKKPDRREFWRGWIENEDGRLVLKKFARDGSALISGLRQAEGLIEVAEEVTEVKPGDPLSFIPFTEFGLPPR